MCHIEQKICPMPLGFKKVLWIYIFVRLLQQKSQKVHRKQIFVCTLVLCKLAQKVEIPYPDDN